MIPCPGYSITTPYWKSGSAWSCGYHDGVDYAAPAGTKVVAAWGGTVVEAAYPTSFGPAFGRAVVIDHDKLPDGSAGGWGLYAHLSNENVSVGQRVEAGQEIGEVGTTGNSSGNHLHFGVYMTDHWVSCGGKNPQPWIEAGSVEPGDVYLSKLHYGQKDSDSVRRLQDVLNKHHLDPGGEVPVTGNYADLTDQEVIRCQQQHGFGNDAPGTSYVGEAQGEHLFAGSGNIVIDDISEPAPPDETEPPVEALPSTTGILLKKWYSGKPSGTFTLPSDGDWHKLDLDEPDLGITTDSSEHRFIYLRLEFDKTRSADKVFEIKFERADGDETAYDSEVFGTVKDSYPYYNIHMEDGPGNGGKWYAKSTGGTSPVSITTRYAKVHIFYEAE